MRSNKPFILLTFIAIFALLSSNVMIGRAGHEKVGLQTFAQQRGFYIGAAVSMEPLWREAPYQETLKREFNICVAENAFKFSSLQPEKGEFKFDDADYLVDFAESNLMKLRGHTLIWHNQLSDWVGKGNFNRDEAIAIMKDHIDVVVKRYKGKVWAWDVVNEAISEDGKSLRKESFWFKTIGPDYIKLAFQFAHEADPDAILYYNDFSAEDMGTKSKSVYNLVRDLKQQDVPIDGVGWQMHIDTNFKMKSEYKENAKRLADLGLEISVTELDVKVPVPSTPEELTRQANVYRDVTQFCTATPNCRALVLWGFTDKYSWIPNFNKGFGDALIFDADYQPKAAYASIDQVIQSAVVDHPVIANAELTGEDLVISGKNFSKNAQVYINMKQYKAEADKQNPPSILTIKGFLKNPVSSGNLLVQVQNPDGKLSSTYSLTRK